VSEVRARLTGNFWKLLPVSAVSDLGYGIGVAAAPLLAVSLTESPVLVAGLGSLSFLPWLLFALPIGALVDRSDRRAVMGIANVVRAAVMAALSVLVLTGTVGIALLYVAVFAAGATEVFYDSAARAILPQVLPPDQLDRGNSWLTAGETLGNLFVGAPLGALLFSWFDASPFLGMAVGFVVSAAVVFTLPRRPVPRAETSLRAEIAEGWRWLVAHPLLRGLTATSALIATLLAMSNAVMVLYALRVLRISDAQYGLFLTCGGAGGLLGAAVATSLVRRIGRARTSMCVVLCPVAVGCTALTSTVWVAGALFATSAGAVTVWNVVSMSVRQTLVPERIFARVLGVYRMAIWGGIPLGSLLGGILAAHTSLPTVFAVAGGAQLLVTVRVVQLVRRHRAMVDTAG
jgi:MFS family permease